MLRRATSGGRKNLAIRYANGSSSTPRTSNILNAGIATFATLRDRRAALHLRTRRWCRREHDNNDCVLR